MPRRGQPSHPATHKDALPAEIQTPAKEIENDQTVETEKENNTKIEKQTQLGIKESAETENVRLNIVLGYYFKEYPSFQKRMLSKL